jgi:hypothetical protein
MQSQTSTFRDYPEAFEKNRKPEPTSNLAETLESENKLARNLSKLNFTIIKQMFTSLLHNKSLSAK